MIDYSEQLKNLEGNNKNKAIADFFAFGGDPLPREAEIMKIQERIDELEGDIPRISVPVKQAEPPELNVPDVLVYFQNDTPTENNVNTIISDMYNRPNHYEILDRCRSAQDGNGFGLNSKVYFIENLIENITTDTNNKYTLQGGTTSNQYTATGTTGQFGVPCVLNENLIKMYGQEDFRKYYNIFITAGASKLYLNKDEVEYNKALGDRRVAATKHLIVSRLTAMFGAEVANEINKNNIDTIPSYGSLSSGEKGALPENMHLREVKEERVAEITFYRNSVSVPDKEPTLNQQQISDIANLKTEIRTLTLELEKKKKISENIYGERDRVRGSLNGFESVSGNYYSPAFHSQTPEDFHRRLTFLQQCTRQGAAKRYGSVEENGILRARNSVFGKQPICILRVGDFFYTKVIIDNVTIDYNDTTWDLNPEGFGLQPMIANVTLQMKLIGGQSLKGPIDALQNAVSFNYYANSNFNNKGVNSKATKAATDQMQYLNGVLTKKNNDLENKYKSTDAYKREGDV